MPFLPELAVKAQQSLMTGEFRGYNHTPSARMGEMWDMENLSGHEFPTLAPRKERGVVQQLSAPSGMLAKDALAVVDGQYLYYDGYKVQGITLSTEENMTPKQMVSMGAYLCIWPDKVYVNTQDLSEHGTMGATFETVGTTTLTMCRRDGTDWDMESIAVSPSAPSTPKNGDTWLDTSGKKHVLKQYNEGTAEWVQVATVYIKLQSTGIGTLFKEYDTVRLSGLTADEELSEALKEQIGALNTDMVLYGAGDGYIIVAGIIDQAAVIETTVTVERRVPDLDYVTESNNRLWGCKYGMVDGKPVNEIYACKLGDFKNWYSYLGLSTDSYTVSVGSDGVFTGAATLKGVPIFFKENCIHRVTGYGAPYQVTQTMCRGVQDGSWRSLAVVGEALYYKSRTDVMRYDGSMPMPVSAALGEMVYHGAVAGAYGSRYYIAMADGQEQYSLFVFDDDKGVWYKEDDVAPLCFTQMDDDLYYIDAKTKKLMTVNGTAGEKEGTVNWSATFGVIGYEWKDQKYLSRFNLRMKLEKDSVAKLEIQYDSDGIWSFEGEMKGKGTQTFMVPVIPRRCDHCQLRLSGTGKMRLLSVAEILEVGGDG